MYIIISFYVFYFARLGIYVPHLRVIHSFGYDTITGENLRILIHGRRSLFWSCEGSLAYHTYCDTARASIYHCHLRGTMTLIPVAELLALELSLPGFATYVCRALDSNTKPSAFDVNAQTDCATTANFNKMNTAPTF